MNLELFYGIAAISMRSNAIAEISIGIATTSGETSNAAVAIGATVSGWKSGSPDNPGGAGALRGGSMAGC